MVNITYIESTGEEHEIEVTAGSSVMQGAVQNQVRGIIAECGGNMTCATCHVYVEPEWVDKLGEKSEMEKVLLKEVCEPRQNSRLSCQIKVTDELDGLVVRTPEKQI